MTENTESMRIFGPYYNGASLTTFADPFRVMRLLKAATKGELSKVVEDCNNKEDLELKTKATGFLLEAIYIAFEMQPFDIATGKGILENEALAVYDDFVDWSDKKKVAQESGQNSPPPTEVVS